MSKSYVFPGILCGLFGILFILMAGHDICTQVSDFEQASVLDIIASLVAGIIFLLLSAVFFYISGREAEKTRIEELCVLCEKQGGWPVAQHASGRYCRICIQCLDRYMPGDKPGSEEFR